MKNKPNPILVLILTYLFPGMGHIYCGKLIRGYILLIFPFVIIAIFALVGVLNNFNGLLILVSILILYWVIMMVDAYLTAKRYKFENAKDYNKPRYYIGYCILLVLILLLMIQIRNKTIQAFSIPAGSMVPTLIVGDNIMVDKSYYKNNDLKRGDLIVFKFPDDTQIAFIKRVIGLPGDKLNIKGRNIYINGKLSDQKYTGEYEYNYENELKTMDEYSVRMDDNSFKVIYDSKVPEKSKFKLSFPLVVPDNHFFSLGDNRDNSYDSRFWGFVPIENIIGRAKYIYLSYNDNDKIRWNRLGKQIH